MPTHDRSRSPTMRHSTNPPAPAHHQAALSPAQALGNQMMQSMQSKLEVNAPNDSYEQEADNFANQVTNATPAQREAKEPEKKKDDKAAQKKPLAAQATPLIQRAAKEPDKKKDDKAAQKMPVQRADDKKKDDKAAKKAAKEPEKKKDDKATQKMPIQRADDKKKDDNAAQKMPIQRDTTAPKADDDDKAQTKRANPAQLDDKKEKKDDDKAGAAAQTMALQRAADAGTTTAPTSVEQDVERQKQSGRPLSSAERQYFEPRFGADFSQVRIHDDAAAASAASDLNAKAFTQGSDIFFGSGYHQPNDTPGRQLMAHELTHTLQQGGAQPSASAPSAPATTPKTNAANSVQRAGGRRTSGTQSDPGQQGLAGIDDRPATAQPTDTDATQFPENRGHLIPPNTIVFDKLGIPAFKLTAGETSYGKGRYGSANYGPSGGRLARKAGYEREGGSGNEPSETDQRQIWQTGIDKSKISQDLMQKVNNQTHPGTGAQLEMPLTQRFVFKVRTSQGDLFFFGTLSELAAGFTIPAWGSTAARPPRKEMQVDHVVELQVANWNENTGANTLANLELLDRSPNASSGGVIRANIERKVSTFNRDTQGRYGSADPNTPQTSARVAEQYILNNYRLEFREAEEDRGIQARRNDYWLQQEIANANHMTPVEISSFQDFDSQGKIFIYRYKTGGSPWAEMTLGNNIASGDRIPLAPFQVVRSGGKQFNVDPNADVNQEDGFGTLTVQLAQSQLFNSAAASATWQIPVKRIPGSRYAGYVQKEEALARVRALAARQGIQVPRLSPITVDEFDFLDNGLYVKGRIMPSVPILRGTSIDYDIQNGDVRLFKTFAAPEFQVPRPLEIRTAALTVSVGTRSGLAIEGRVDFGIQNLGEGFLEARAQTGTGGASSAAGFSLTGSFNFDSRLFDPAVITMRYENGEFSGEGHIGIPAGKLKGIRSANIDVSYAAGVITANGTVQPSIPGVQQGTLNVVYSETDGLVISGALQLAENPAIRSGSIDARVERSPDGIYKVRASGTAQPKIPGVNSELAVTYDDGSFDMTVTASFARGMLQGQMTAAATNRAVNPDTGQPAGEPTERITVYGGGSVTVQFAPWLQGTAGIKLLPNGEIEISGSIGLPNTVNIFDARRFDRNIFHVNIDIPIVGLSVAGQRVGVFATIGGGLDLRAGIGPGQLQNLNLGVTYNPSHEDQTHVTGHGEFVIPADAGLRLSIHGGVGVGIPIVSAEAGIEMSGELGLQGEARAAVDVDWTPQRGIVLDAQGSLFVEPRLKLDVSAYVSVKADLLLTTIDLYSHRWRLAGTEIGSNLRFGVTFPIHYEQGKPFNLSSDDVNFVIPEIDPQSILSGIFG